MNDDLTTRLSRQLHEQVDGWHGAPLTLDSVRGRAHTIRRTRRLAAAGAAAVAVAAIALPTTLLGGTNGRTDAPPEIADTPTLAGDGSVLHVPYVTGRTLTMPDGSERELPQAYGEVTVWGDEVLGTTGAPGTAGYTLQRLGDDATVEETVALGGSGIARNADGSAIAYVTPEAHMVVESAEGQVDLGPLGEVRGLAAVRPLRLLGGPGCVQAGDCVVYFEDGESEWLLGASGGAPVGAEDLAVHDVSENGLVSVLTSVDETEPASCSEIREWKGDARVLETCDHTPARFSPSGSHITGLPSYLSGIGPSRIAILDSTTGEELAAYEPRSGYVSDSRSIWEDDDHLLVMAYEFRAGTWSVTRLGVDGSQQRLLGPTKGSEDRPPWSLVGGL